MGQGEKSTFFRTNLRILLILFIYDIYLKVYESVGRMFLLSDIANVRSGLDKKTDNLKEKISVLNSNKEYLDRQVKEQENNLRELITSKKKSN